MGGQGRSRILGIGTSLPQHDPEAGKGLGRADPVKQRAQHGGEGDLESLQQAKGQGVVTTVTCQLHLGTGKGLGSSCWRLLSPRWVWVLSFNSLVLRVPSFPARGQSWW